MVRHGMLDWLRRMAGQLEQTQPDRETTGRAALLCDATARHSLKLVMKVIFEVRCFRNEIAWCQPSSPRAGAASQRKRGIRTSP